MNLASLGFKQIPVATTQTTGTPTQAQINQQAAVGGGVESARDKVVRDSRKAASMKLVSNRVATRNVLDRAGVTKVVAAKRG